MDRGVFGSWADAESTTLAKLVDRYPHEIASQKRRAAMERSHIKAIGQDPIARCFAARITGRELTAYKNRRLAVVAGSTLNRELNVLSHVFTVAAQEWHIHLPWGNPVRLLSRPRVNDKRDRRLVGDELPRLLAAAQAYGGSAPQTAGHIGPIIIWAIETAMRRGENLVPSDLCGIIPKTNTITMGFRRTIGSPRGGYARIAFRSFLQRPVWGLGAACRFIAAWPASVL